jgi:hypothetical protein
LDQASLAVAPPSVSLPINNGGARPGLGHSWDEMFAVCKHNAENGFPSDAYQTNWMSEQRKRKEKLDSIGFAWNVTGISEQAQGNENSHQVRWMGSICCEAGIVLVVHSIPRI